MRKSVAFILILLLLTAAAMAQLAPLPQDTGAAGLQQELRKLHTTARLLQITAHPDDEDGAMLTLEARGRGAQVMLLTLTRGEGGQNKMGSTLFDALGVLRTLELLAADRYYGVEQRFTRVADFGFSKSAQETFEKWHGHDVALGDMVRVIREFRPDVIVSRFTGTPRDGHGHHQASGILAREAFKAAADPNRFPDQIKQGLQPWQAKKFYIGAREGDDWTVELNTDEVDTALGMSYAQFAMQGLKHQLSQGAGDWNMRPGPHFSRYKLFESTLPMPTPGTKEKDFFDGIDTSLEARTQGRRTPRWMTEQVSTLEKLINDATDAVQRNARDAALVALLEGRATADEIGSKATGKDVPADVRASLLPALSAKRKQLNAAANDLVGGHVEISIAGVPQQEGMFLAAPGQNFMVDVRAHADMPGVRPRVRLSLPRGWTAWDMPHENSTSFRVSVPMDAQVTRPNWQRNDPEADTIYYAPTSQPITLPLPPLPLNAVVDFISPSVSGHAGTAPGGQNSATPVDYAAEVTQTAPLAVAPRVSVAVDPLENVIRTGGQGTLAVTAEANTETPITALARLEAAPEVLNAPPPQPIQIAPETAGATVKFPLKPVPATDRQFKVKATVDVGGTRYADGVRVVGRPDIGAFPYYQPSVARVSVVDVKVPQGLKVGYVMGAGDDIPQVLREIGINVQEIKPEDLKTANFAQFGTIVLGIRAYDTKPEVRAANQRLLEFVTNGGTLVVQYNSDVSTFNNGKFTPFPADLSRERVTVEQAPVQVLAQADPIFHYPNEITPRDFQGWVQERGLYFMDQWAPQFTPLLASNDPGEQPQKGGLLVAHVGKGTYIYTGYAFFRQLPFGVPGAVRLFVNLISAGHGH